MPKLGIKLDYDLRANEAIKKEDKCIICGNRLVARWTDYNGEGVCITCGCAYQLINGTEEQIKDNKYPYCNLKKEFIPIIKKYWEETNKFVFTGASFSEDTGVLLFDTWFEKNYPERAKKMREKRKGENNAT